jgi:hypothetical protein
MRDDKDLNRIMGEVRVDVYLMRQFGGRHQIQMGVWTRVPVDQRARFIAQGYVMVTEHVVYLTPVALEVLGYREATA